LLLFVEDDTGVANGSNACATLGENAPLEIDLALPGCENAAGEGDDEANKSSSKRLGAEIAGGATTAAGALLVLMDVLDGGLGETGALLTGLTLALLSPTPPAEG
jgi:hypothetical protein